MNKYILYVWLCNVIIMLCIFLRLVPSLEPVPLTHTHGPGSDHPAGHAEDQQHRPGTHGHQSLHHEARVEADLVQSTDTVRRGVREKPACAHETRKKYYKKRNRKYQSLRFPLCHFIPRFKITQDNRINPVI